MIIRFIIIAVIFILIFSAIRKFIFGSIKRRLYARMEKRFVGQRIILTALNANFFGQQSKGGMQVRGNGALVLTEIELWFCLAAPEREISIPVSQISKVELKRSHLGKTVFRPLLYVEFSSATGSDSIAWAVQNPGKWKDAIEEVLKQD